ncbi:PREDICTED: uncharacterized protein LOC104819076 [Tarenaya hassleriana]|uniref:uncharacterized protein LOC104819076 n=1 Tax=Tarenaya hassleriana TaxID=28532 RepID=UPI00053C4761|nr:PREDICTED: uncharacterized protein LOC104819076 [Tarenaya hassleriana]
MEASDYDGSFDSTTNWRISGGSLVDSITFESSFSSPAGDLDEFAAADSAAKSPLILLPLLPSSDPCEITITFSQKHELRQVYVRSTARVYEIYCANRPKQGNEYLCTVRCGLATRGEEVLQSSVVKATALVSHDERSNGSEGKKVKDNGSGGKSEDDWVEVKASDASLLNNARSLPVKPQGRTQDFFEATAEINDTEPCISITLRFLSLQDKGCVCIDEVYIFGDPADPTESEHEANGAGNSAGNSLMAMFMPTLLQLSRAKSVNRERDKQTSNEYERKSQETMRNSDDVDKIVNGNQQESTLSKTDDQKVNLPTTTERADPESSQHVSGAEIKPASSYDCTNIILHQLVYRVSRIEDILTRFEDQLLKPINSIDLRLQQVEKKLEELGKKSNDLEGSAGPKVLDPGFTGSNTDRSRDIELDGQIQNQHLASCSRIVAPEFSCGDTDLDSSCTSKSENYDVALKHEEDDIHTVNSSENMVDLPSENRSQPGTEMIATESEISNEKEVDHSVGRESSEDKPKRPLSINDALASALAGFLTSTSTTDKKYSQALVVTAPEFSNEDDSETDKNATNDTHPDKSPVTSDCLAITDKAICINDLQNKEPTVVTSPSARSGPGITAAMEGDSSEMVSEIAETCNHSEAGNLDADTEVRDGDSDLGGGAVAETMPDRYAEGTEKESENQETTKDKAVDEPKSPNLSTGFPSCEPKIGDVLQSVLGFQCTSSSLDLETPILDVKFNSEQTSNSKSFFEALLSDSPESTSESVVGVDCIDESTQDNLISVDDEELIGPPTDTLSSLDIDYFQTSCMHLDMDDETQSEDLHRLRP